MPRKRKQSLFLLDHAGTSAVLRQRLASGRWWTFITVALVGLPFIESVERKFYCKRANRDFEMFGFPHVAGLSIRGFLLVDAGLG